MRISVHRNSQIKGRIAAEPPRYPGSCATPQRSPDRGVHLLNGVYPFVARHLERTQAALVSVARDNGDFAAALRHARELLTLDPGNTQLQALVSELEKKARP